MSSYFYLPGSNQPDFLPTLSSSSPGMQWQALSSVNDLTAHRDTVGVVVLDDTYLNLPTQLAVLRSVAPKLTPVILTLPDEIAKLSDEIVVQADLLSKNSTSIEVKARLNAAMQLSELKHIIENTSQLDEIKTLYTYHYFVKRLGEEIALAKRHLSPVTCLILNIHSYDLYMDIYGHDRMFDLLEAVSKMVKQYIRQEDIAARLGNNEIGVLLPHSTEKGALSLSQRLVKNLSTLKADPQEEDPIRVNMGIAGFTASMQETMDADTLIRYARHALHHARCQEENSIQLFSEMKPFVG